MSQTLIVEIIAIIVGLIVVGIETAIIILLRRHMLVLKKNHEKNSQLFNELKTSINNHIDSLNKHSKISDDKLSRIFHEICTPIIKRQSDKRNTLKTKNGTVEKYSKLIR